MKRLCEALRDHAGKDIYPCHMPGHKGNPDTGFLKEVLKYDITEIDGLDNLHDAQGVILESEKYAARQYGSDITHFLTGGSTAGILSAVAAVTEPGDEILIGRNCHRSVYNAVELNRLKCRYLYPGYIEKYGICGMTEPGDVERALKDNTNIRAVVITSPTYEGICSDVKSIAEKVHKSGKILIVDAAHGAHFGFHDGFPESAVKQGADIVIHSVHKTLPSPTQTALIHINGDIVDRESVKRMLSIYQSSSPSYLLMAGIDNCMSILGDRGSELFSEFFKRFCRFEKDLDKLKRIRYINRKLLREKCGIYDADPGKLIISVKGSGITGRELYDMLRNEYLIQPEMAADSFCLLIMTVMDTDESFERVKNALYCIDEKLSQSNGTDIRMNSENDKDKVKADTQTGRGTDINRLYLKPAEQIMPVYETLSGSRRIVNIDESTGEISADYIALYPPGIPLLVPGERISAELTEGIRKALAHGLTVQGLTKDGKMKVITG